MPTSVSEARYMRAERRNLKKKQLDGACTCTSQDRVHVVASTVCQVTANDIQILEEPTQTVIQHSVQCQTNMTVPHEVMALLAENARLGEEVTRLHLQCGMMMHHKAELAQKIQCLEERLKIHIIVFINR